MSGEKVWVALHRGHAIYTPRRPGLFHHAFYEEERKLRNNRPLRWLILLSAGGIILAGCTGGTDGPAGPVETGKMVVDRDGLILNLATPATTYRSGRRIQVTASVENRRSDPVRYFDNCAGAPYVGLDAGPFGGKELLEAKREPPICPAAETTRILQPGERLTRRVEWDQMLPYEDGRTRAPDGTYQIAAGVTVVEEGETSYDRRDAMRIQAELEITIVGGGRLLTPDEAIQRAREVPEVAEWYSARSGSEALVREEDGSGDPIVASHLSGGRWEIRFGQKLAPPPHEAAVVLNASTGEVLQVQFCEKFCK